jgi:2-oxoglutarate dehydrogenase E1 component
MAPDLETAPAILDNQYALNASQTQEKAKPWRAIQERSRGRMKLSLRDFYGPNAGYVLELYERYRADPDSVGAETRELFERWTPTEDGAAPAPAPALAKVVGAVNLAHAIRAYGHLAARLDPPEGEAPGDPSLALGFHGLTEGDLAALPASLVGGPIAETASNAREAIAALRAIYSGTTGYDYEQVRNPEERAWLRHAAESGAFRPTPETFSPRGLLVRLTQIEVFEQFLHGIFPGKYRFSVEGLDMMVPMLDELMCEAAGERIANILIGMAHRGRLNVMAHILAKPYSQILAEFKDPLRPNRFESELGWTGDVKYHKGAQHRLIDGPVTPVVTMPPNPSHLESVNPVVEGMARAAGTDVGAPGEPAFDPDVTLPILIHGDAAFPGQGVVAETFNLSRLPGYWTGGTIHIIANNQIGFTTWPDQGRSTIYASDLAKGFRVPIVHVNADDPEACIEAARLAAAYRARFRKDVVVDLIGYRRYGHNEGDEPAFTQPVLYDTIRHHPTVRERWAETLAARGEIEAGEAQDMITRLRTELQEAYEALEPEEDLREPTPEPPPPGAARRVDTAVPLAELQTLNDALLALPEGFSLNAKLARFRERRRERLADPDAEAVDWATAEELALASILVDGTAIRLTGQDAERGTFSQRHAVFHDEATGERYTPLQHIPQARAAFEIRNSPLSENAALGFEYGYNIQAPGRLVIWEAQYGDFVNNAQTVIDEFIVSARAKWGQTPSLVLLLPHGFEGAGPDHSSGRLERFLQLAAETNIRIANATTAAQFFHLLRRQAALLESDPLPLVVMTPKSLLRHPLVNSTLQALAEGRWQPVIDDARAAADRRAVRRLVFVSGKFYVDLAASGEAEGRADVALARVEQLYPFPVDAVRAALDAYPDLSEVVWAQEEPENMGAWEFVRPRLEGLIGGRWPLRYVGRARNASPAEGSSARHAANQARLITTVFEDV